MRFLRGGSSFFWCRGWLTPAFDNQQQFKNFEILAGGVLPFFDVDRIKYRLGASGR